MESKTAEVVALVAEVRALMVGSRQITLSVFRQLDVVKYTECDPMGRINGEDGAWIVGKDKATGQLVRADFNRDYQRPRWERGDEEEYRKAKRTVEYGCRRYDWMSAEDIKNSENAVLTAKDTLETLESFRNQLPELQRQYDDNVRQYRALPLIILAGLR